MDEADFERAASFWERREQSGKRMEDAALLAEITKFACSHNTCALATGSGTFVRCTPIEYTYTDGSFYLFSEGGQKFRALAVNPLVSLAVFDQYSGMDSVNGMQVTGRAVLVEPFSGEYLKLLAVKGIPSSALASLEYTMHLIKVIPSRVDMLCSAFKRQGFNSRQYVLFGGE
jgi:Pyridoxamine 5''-phosphate oxidase.